ncbi:MAG: ATP-binding cassette domain-containing protein, partial [Ignavibacteriales bacterium]
MSAIIQVQNVSKSYWRDSFEVPVLNDLSLEVNRGDFVALMGPSGSGKTTLLNMIAGIDRPSKGKLIVDGTDISTLGESSLAKWRSAKIGFVFQ